MPGRRGACRSTSRPSLRTPTACPTPAGHPLLGGTGKPLVITVSCGETATVTVETTLQPPTGRSRAAAATVDKVRKKKRKKVTIKLKTTTVTAIAGKRVPISLKIPRCVRKKYAGKTVKATITVTARDASGNVKKTKTTRKVKLAKAKKRKHRH
jgi:hypothetical protein